MKPLKELDAQPATPSLWNETVQVRRASPRGQSYWHSKASPKSEARNPKQTPKGKRQTPDNSRSLPTQEAIPSAGTDRTGGPGSGPPRGNRAGPEPASTLRSCHSPPHRGECLASGRNALDFCGHVLYNCRVRNSPTCFQGVDREMAAAAPLHASGSSVPGGIEAQVAGGCQERPRTHAFGNPLKGWSAGRSGDGLQEIT